MSDGPVVKKDGAIKKDGAKKAKRLTSWQRKATKKKANANATAATTTTSNEASLNQACAAAKAASLAARERYRLGGTGAMLPGDAELVAAYVAAKSAMKAWHEAKPDGSISKRKKQPTPQPIPSKTARKKTKQPKVSSS